MFFDRWDMILGRHYGLGCQSVIGARLVLWDGSVLHIDEGSDQYKDLLFAIRGGAAAGIGIITQLRLQLIDEPSRATWTFKYLNKSELDLCISHKTFERAEMLPRDISVASRFFFEQDRHEPICNFIVTSLLTVEETIDQLKEYLDHEVISLISDRSRWNEKKLLDLRLIPASDAVKANPTMLNHINPQELHDDPFKWWQPEPVIREMASSFFTSISYWIRSNSDQDLAALYQAFDTKKDAANRARMYCLVVQGGGRMTELQDRCSMPLGKALARFEYHWDDAELERKDCRDFTARIESILQTMKDPGPNRSYRGDIWLKEQASDDILDRIMHKYDRRWSMSPLQNSARVVSELSNAVDVTNKAFEASGQITVTTILLD